MDTVPGAEAVVMSDGRLWDRFVDAHPRGELFSRWGFLKAVEKYSGCQLLPLGFFEGSELVGLLPLCLTKMYGLRVAAAPAPKMMQSHQGLLVKAAPGMPGSRDDRLSAIARAIDNVLAEVRPDYARVRVPPGFTDFRPFLSRGYGVNVLYNYEMDLSVSLEEQWNALGNSCRHDIQSAGKRPLEIRREWDADHMLRLHRSIIDPANHPAYPRQAAAFLNELFTLFPENMRMYFLYDGGDAIGVDVTVCYKDLYYPWIRASKKGYSEYFEWQGIRRAKQEGFRRIMNEDANTQRLVPFKSKFNYRLEAYFELERKDTIARFATWTYNHVRPVYG